MTDHAINWGSGEEGERTRAAHIAVIVRGRICRLELRPGQAITEGDLAAEHNIAKPTAREALQAVVNEGLLSPVRGSGYVVSPITLADGRNLLEWWRHVLPLAIEYTARRGIADSFREVLPQMIEGWTAADADTTADVADDRSRDVTATLLSGNIHAVASVTRLWHPIQRLIRFAMEQGATFESEPTWLDVFEAVQRRDPAGARAAAEVRAASLERTIVDALIRKAVDENANLAG